ncbi:hypothetical protein [Chryseobacterium vrystaatense]|uniref:Lipoprotein n=1 Tax=Chryseobacterium vrystaatense TaxID=307480 RepID=A0A1M4TDH3_9FLAO|nr:hypothetical protein [Chryseobacterium vrystaatense]SHE42552.1 hypothetical protein SAMN02787073_0330 [Chryseobacterium vrystaatense]
MKFKLKHIFILKLIAILFLMVSCGSDDDSLQRIDQVMNFYMQNNTGQDLLNAKKTGSYTTFSVNDDNGATAVVPVSIPLKMTTDSLFYFEYVSGAKRIIKDSISPENKTYRSNLTFSLRRTVNNQVVTVTDVMEIHYRWTPTLFQVSEVLYNGKVVFSKAADAPNAINTFTIIK